MVIPRAVKWMAKLNNTGKKSCIYLFLASVLTVFVCFFGFLYKQNNVNLFKMYGHDCGFKAAGSGVKKHGLGMGFFIFLSVAPW